MHMDKKITVIGSCNTDMVVNMERLPLPGETLIGGKFFMNPGGKGANQAVAAARLGRDVTFVAKVGNDSFGQRAIEQYKAEGIETRYVLVDGEQPSGVALIMVDAQGENCIAAGKAGAAISYALGQGAPMVAALWGIFVWKEFKGASGTVNTLLALMFLFFISGLGAIIVSGAN